MLKMVIVVNSDISMSPGKLAVQVAHAAVTGAARARRARSSPVKQWVAQGQKKVVVKAPAVDFADLEKKARLLGLTTAVINDAGLTELAPGTMTALAIGPGEEATIDKVTGQLPLK
jgi:PTH2 family peptidyl-tRNA hydrolase